MPYKMRINFVDVVVPDSLHSDYVSGKKVGYQFKIRLSYYRGHFLSVIDRFAVAVDGEEVPSEHIKFCINGKAFSPVEFDKCYSEFWQVIEPATVRIFQPGGLSEGEHRIDVTLDFHSPYMPIGPNHQYMPIDGSGSGVLTLKD
ncbi:C-glycoside deglycosidase beta subunit domain-containing protein [Lachnoclostridium sp. Marseille-P6806]|uniref:C-glycoside deglycosidase beta subunit domain-containing protein n=1 Tax=Lachnoclostridium sp. Marseille-P6806 TaxID=2364793 RepID=UPI00102FD52E|nr:DUF6379 domain-containing protein [Lachnoclostridium sp. Marseille-P6806]